MSTKLFICYRIKPQGKLIENTGGIFTIYKREQAVCLPKTRCSLQSFSRETDLLVYASHWLVNSAWLILEELHALTVEPLS